MLGPFRPALVKQSHRKKSLKTGNLNCENYDKNCDNFFFFVIIVFVSLFPNKQPFIAVTPL